MHDPLRVLILCTGNSARSQMAEGLLRTKGGSRFAVYSAGSKPGGSVHPMAVQVMLETGIDISHQWSKHVNQFLDDQFNYVLTVCDHAAETCPHFPGEGERIHKNFPDPADVTDETQLMVFRQVRDDIDAWLTDLFGL